MTVTIPSKKLDGLSARLGAFMSRLAALADRPRSPTGTTPEDRADRQRAVAFASPERSELGINDEVAAPHPPGPTSKKHHPSSHACSPIAIRQQTSSRSS